MIASEVNMVNISTNNLITMTAGDYFKSPVFINAGTELEPLRYTLRSGEKLMFAVLQQGEKFEDALIRKEFTDEDINAFGDVEIKLVSEDTCNVRPGIYHYTIKLLLKKDNINCIITIVDGKLFTIL